MLDNNKKIILNVHMYIFIIIATIALINDNIIFITSLSYEISLVISCVIVIILNIFLLRKGIFEIKTDFNKLDLIGIIPYCILYGIVILYIDDFVDTMAYHLYNQKNPFLDKTNFDLLPSSSFFFPLGDRMSYIFVNFFGYRFGHILSFYSSVVIFYQIKNFLNIILPNTNVKIKIFIASIILYTMSVNLCIGRYNVDIFSAVILLELLYIAIKDINIFKFKNYMHLSIFLSGIAIGIKITNIVFISLILFYMVVRFFKEHRNLKIYDLILDIILFFIPFAMYMMNSYIQTNNPFFPFLNIIFKSEYYEIVSAKDPRLGPKNIFEIILWPLIITINPLKGDDINGLVDPIWGMGYIILIYCLIKQKENKKILNLVILNILLTLIWIIFVSGYVRYAMFIAISYFFIEIYILNKIISEIRENNEINILDLFIKFVVIAVMVIQILISLFMGISYICTKIEDTITNISYEVEENTISGIYDIDGVWISCRYNTACIDLIRDKNNPICNADILIEKDPMMKISNNYSEIAKKKLFQKINR